MTKQEKDAASLAGWYEPSSVAVEMQLAHGSKTEPPGGRVVYYDSALAEPKANHEQVGGDHYRKMPLQLWDFVASNRMGYLEGNIIKYVTRWSRKGGVEDLMKARHYLEKLIELQGPSGATEAKR